MDIASYTKEYILSDVAKLQYLYKMKEVIRYDQTRSVDDSTESVAEHVYGMQILAQYFLPLEDPKKSLDKARIYELITIHDLDEIETGDYLSFIKNDSHRKESENAIPKVLTHIPEHIKESVTALVNEYELQQTPESQFTKAIDKIEPLIQVYSEKARLVTHRNKCTPQQSWSIKEKYIKNYPFITAYATVMHTLLTEGGYYYTEEK